MRVNITVTGLVQGVGYRPFVLREAKRLSINGSVRNSGGIVTIAAEGKKEALDEFIQCLGSRCPGAYITGVETIWLTEEIESEGSMAVSLENEMNYPKEFVIAESEKESDKSDSADYLRDFSATKILPPDIATCPRCEAERKDPKNRRYRHPFISCVSCGPRYSILRELPYDRETTTMTEFSLCPICKKEYRDAGDVRCHAQTIACPDCGPRLSFHTREGKIEGDEPALRAAISALKEGNIIAIKDIGGYHLACLPNREETVFSLRELKGREKKTFAVMFPDLDSVREYAHLSDEERAMLTGPERPIVLLNKKKDFPSAVCGESREIGALLPCNPVQSLLLEETGALIMTSANRSGQPIIIGDLQMISWMGDDSRLYGVLTHDRRILTPLDDSVMRLCAGRKQMIRRARGFVPLPILLKNPLPCEVFAAGGDLKASFAFAKGKEVWLSQYFGNLDEWEVFQTWEQNIGRLRSLLRIEEQERICDCHPDYAGVAYVRARGKEISYMEVQHHKAHILSVMAEHGLRSNVLGFSFDGTGYGEDHSVWGGEVFLFSGEYTAGVHLGGLEPVLFCGGDAAAKDGILAAVCHLFAQGLDVPDILSFLPSWEKWEEKLTVIARARDMDVNCSYSSSMGRLFDAVAAVLGISLQNDYEGESAVLLEIAAAEALENGTMPEPLAYGIETSFENIRWRLKPLWDGLLEGIRQNKDKNALALGFHYAVGDVLCQTAEWKRGANGINQIALSGGVFTNRILTEYCVARLQERGFSVFLNEKVPCNDGGIALGQVWARCLSKE